MESRLELGIYQKGTKVSDWQMKTILLENAERLGQWKYVIYGLNAGLTEVA